MAAIREKESRPDMLSAADKLGAKGEGDWRVLCGDSLSLLPQLPDASADLIFADPPYNLQLKKALYRPNGTEVEGVNDEWDKFSSFEEYDDFCRKWLGECRRLLTDSGSLWVIGTYHNIFRIGRLMQDIGFWLLNDIIWHKTNPMPNFRGVRFTNATETLLWAKRSEKSRYVFNNKLMKEENGGKQMPNVWRIPLCTGKERLRDANGDKLHSTQKPLALLRRIILSSTKPGDMVLDPFMGSGTTPSAAKQTNRKSIGIDRTERYITAATERIKTTPAELIQYPAEQKSQPRVSFEDIIGRGLIKAGRKLYAKNGAVAVIQKNGTIKLNGNAGSIHKIAAQVARTPTCNGWHFWSFDAGNGGGMISINELREQARRDIPR